MCNLYLFLIVFTVTLNASGSIKRNNYNNKNNDRRCRLLITKKARRGTKKQKVCIGRTTTLDVLHPGGGRGRVLRIWIDRDDRKISGFFWVGEFWQVFFWVAEFQYGFFGVLYHLMLSGNVLERGWGLNVGPVVIFGGEEWLF